MSKTEWKNLKPGERVTMTLNDILSPFTHVVYYGTIIRANSNWSQVLVKWDDSNAEHWYGRLGIEILK